ncbi:Tc toxin subunit A [Pseudescherichia vulneris]|uniref:Tc toxin subunit A n=1 Tax=Pseudescherichia vulneris TaxID=566 RepID=UPI003015AC01
MTLFASPALQQVESALKVSPGSFTKNNYRSVFDIARTSRKQFIADNMSWLGLRGGKAWDLAVGQAQHIRRLFRESQLTRQIRQGLPQTLSGQQVVNSTSSNNIQGLVQDGPTWRNQFAENWQAYCQSGAPEAVDSPVSYLTWLYKQALTFEQEIQASSSADQVITLAERRPDLATLTVDNDAINQQIPALQLVNEILENNIATSLPLTQSVDETLAQTRYPTLLPYHFPHDQVVLALLNAGVPLEEMIAQTATDWPWFLNDLWQGARSNTSIELASGLAPEQQTLVTEPDHSTGSDLTTFYKTNLGLETADYTPFEDLDTFTHQLGLTVPQVEGLVAGSAGGTSVILSENCSKEFPLSTEEAISSISQDTGSKPVPLTLSNVGLSATEGKFSGGIRCNALQHASMYIEDNISTDGTNTIPFTIAFWCKIPSDVPDQAVIITNKTDKYALSSKGITLFARHDGETYSLEITISDGSNEPLSKTNTFKPDTWIYIAIEVDANNVMYLLGSNDGKTLDIYQTLNVEDVDPINLAQEYWGFNGNKGNDYYNAYPEHRANIKYDDIAVWNSGLTYTTLSNYIISGKPASSLSDAIHYYTLDTFGTVANQSQYGAAFINAGGNNVITLDLSAISQLVFSDTTFVAGKYNQGIQTRSADDSYFYFQPDGRVAQAMKGDNSFTLGFWSYRENTSQLPLPYFSNGADARDPSYAPGFELTSYDNNTDVQFAVTDNTGKNSSNSWKYYIDKGKWYYLALSWNAETRQAEWYTIADGLSVTEPTVTLDASGLGDITTADGFTWAFNIRGDLTRHNSAPDNVLNLIYDDVAVFSGALTATEINAIATSGKPIGETDLSGFSADCIWYPSLDHGLQNLSDARMDRINRMVRLQRWLGLSYEETDLLLSACIRAQGTDNADFSLNAHTLRALGVFRHWQQKYGVNAFEFAAVLNEITPYAISPAVPFFDQVFNSPSLFDEPLAITGDEVSYTEVTGESARTVRQICAGLNITQAQFRVLADKVAAEQGNPGAKTFPLTLPVVSAFYRLVMVPRWLGLSFAEGAALLSLAGEGDTAWTMLAGVPQLAALSGGQPAGGDILDLLMALDAAAAWAADHQLSWVKNYLVLQPETDALVATPATVNFVNGIKQQLPATLLSEQNFSSVPLPEYNSCVNIYGDSTPADSPLGKAHGIQLDSTQGQYAVFTDTADTLITGASSYTIGMWVKVTTGASVNFPVIANASVYNQSTSPGIFISLGSSYHLNISIASDDPDCPLVSNSSATSWQIDKWFWLAIATDVMQQTVTVYAYSEDGSITSSVSLSYEGSILTESGNCWALSQNGVLNNTGTQGVISYDDVTVWDSVLTAENIEAIVASDMPATLTVPAALPVLVADTDFLSDLIDSNGLVLPFATDYNAIVTMVSADIDAADITFNSNADKEHAISSLSGIIWQARQAQNGIADSALAQMFGTGQSLPPYLLQWAGDSEYRLLSDSLTLNSGAALTDPSQVPATYLTDLFALGQRAGITTAFTLTPAALSIFLAHPDWFGVSDTTLSLTLLYRFSRYDDWLKVAEDEDRVLAYLSWVNGATPPDGGQAADALALLLGWESSEVADATAALPGGLAKTVPDVDYVLRLQQLSTQTGLSVTPLLTTGELAPGSVTETWDAWQSAGESLVAAQQ